MAKTDIELLTAIKVNNSNESKLELWKRYNNKVHSFHYKNSNFFKCANVSFDEFFQESYIAFEKAIDYINFDKMEKSGSTSFATSFYFFLLKVKNKYQKEFHRYGNPIMLSEIFSSNNENNYTESIQTKDSIDFNEKTKIDFDSIIMKGSVYKIVHEYTDALDNGKKEILELYLENKKISEISKSLKIKYNEVYKTISKAKIELAVKFNEEAII